MSYILPIYEEHSIIIYLQHKIYYNILYNILTTYILHQKLLHITF